MHLKPTLLMVLLRTPLLAALVAECALSATTLFPRTVLTWHDPLPLFLLATLAAVFEECLSRSAHRYVMTRGFSSTCLWGHALLAGFVVLAVALLPPTMLLWTGLRSSFQSFTNPLYPLMAPEETYIPFFWLAAGALLMVSALFANVRAAQPNKSRSAGPLIFSALSVALFTIAVTFPRLPSWRFWFVVIPCTLLGLALTALSRSLHRSMEVSS